MSLQISGLATGTTVRGKVYRMLVVLFVVMLVCTATYLSYSQRLLIEQLVKRQTTDLAESYFDNINTLMLTGGMANRAIPRKKVLARPEVVDARIIRAPATIKLYGPGEAYAAARDELDRRALAGETIYELNNGTDSRVLTVVVPLPASKDFRGTDCLGCHAAHQGEVLGAVRIDYSLKALDAMIDRDLMANIGINSTLRWSVC